MYAIVAIVVVLAIMLLFVLDRALKAIAVGRRRREAGVRLYYAAARAAEREKQRRAAAEASDRLTTVLPAIPQDDRTPRKVA